MKEAAMPCQDFPRKRGHARLFFVAALLAWLVPFLPLSFASAAMTARAAGVEVPADFGEEIHTGEEATARVLSVRAAGPVEQGAGHVVTGTFQTWNADVRELWMEGLEAPVRVTGGHRFYSASRGWVEAHRLAVGETVRTRDGSGARVLGLERLPGVHAVFNLEVEGLHQYHVSPLGLLAHNTDCTPTGSAKVAGEASEAAANKKTYVTYTKTNPETGEVYSGRASGVGTPEEIVAARDASHHMSDKGFGKAELDKSSANKDAIRGREQQLIDAHGGAKRQGGTSGNEIRGVSEKNKNRTIYEQAANKEFGIAKRKKKRK